MTNRLKPEYLLWHPDHGFAPSRGISSCPEMAWEEFLGGYCHNRSPYEVISKYEQLKAEGWVPREIEIVLKESND